MSQFLDLIGTPRYPVNGPVQVFRPEEGRPVVDEMVAGIVRMLHAKKPFRSGLCYGNTDRIIETAHANEVRGIRPFAGWLLIHDTAPIHHSWVVYGKNQIIDLAQLKNVDVLNKAFNEKWSKLEEQIAEKAKLLTDTREQAALWVEFQIAGRTEWIETNKVYEDGDVVENRVWGVPPSNMIYAGCPCPPDEAKKIFNNWHKKYGKTDRMEGPGEASITQLIESGQGAKARARLLDEANRISRRGT